MNDQQLQAIYKQGVKLMGEGYSWAEAVLQVMREVEGWDQSPYQWATTGYTGAINTGKTICGALFGGAIVLGYLHGKDAKEAPDI